MLYRQLLSWTVFLPIITSHLTNNNTFQGLAGLKTLHLEHNRLEQLTGHEFTALHYLEELYLNDNKLVWVAEKAFESLRSLQVRNFCLNLTHL